MSMIDSTWEDNTKIDIKETGLEDVDYISLV
jgi:hypothetical protein